MAQRIDLQYILANFSTGASATFNNNQDPNFVGYIEDISGLDSAEVRENAALVSEGDGAFHGPFWLGRRPITISGIVIPPNPFTQAAYNARIDKILAASLAIRTNSNLTWLEEGRVETVLDLRTQQPTRIAGSFPRTFFINMVSADPRIKANQETTNSHATSTSGSNVAVTNNGNAGADWTELVTFPSNLGGNYTLEFYSGGTVSAPTGLYMRMVLTGIPQATNVYIKMGTREIVDINGVSLYNLLTVDQLNWVPLNPGTTFVRRIPSVAGVTAQFSYRHSWV